MKKTKQMIDKENKKSKAEKLNYIYEESKKEFDRKASSKEQSYAIYKNNIWINKSAQDLDEYLELKMLQLRCETSWNWLKSPKDILITEDGNLDEITMFGEFNEEMDLIKNEIQLWKNSLEDTNE